MKLSVTKPARQPRKQPLNQFKSMKLVNKQKRRARRQQRVRARVFGTAAKPRLNVFRGLLGTYAQLIDDSAGKTLVAVHSKKVEVKKADVGLPAVALAKVGERKAKVAVAYLVGKTLAEKAKALGITKAVFDRGGYKYHGRVAAVADGARAGGLEF